jgi:hypothetical protein
MGVLVILSTQPPPRPVRWLVYPVTDQEGAVRSDVVVEAPHRYRACAEGARLLGLDPVDVDAIALAKESAA